MQEIKFRAWDKNLSWMREVRSIDFKKRIINAFGVKGPNSGTTDLLDDEYELMQFTGLKDKNRKEIYEGDIVVSDEYIWFDDGKPNYRGVVEWVYSQWQVIAHCINSDKLGISDGVNYGLNDAGVDEGACSKWEVIGNIYEDPELIRQNTNARR